MRPHPKENNLSPEQGKERAHSIDSPCPSAARSPSTPAKASSRCEQWIASEHRRPLRYLPHRLAPQCPNRPHPCQPPPAQTITRGKRLSLLLHSICDVNSPAQPQQRKQFLRLEMSHRPTLCQNKTPREGLEGA